MPALSAKEKTLLQFAARIVIALTVFFTIDYFIDASDTERFIIGPLAPFAELIICGGFAFAAFFYSKRLF